MEKEKNYFSAVRNAYNKRFNHQDQQLRSLDLKIDQYEHTIKELEKKKNIFKEINNNYPNQLGNYKELSFTRIEEINNIISFNDTRQSGDDYGTNEEFFVFEVIAGEYNFHVLLEFEGSDQNETLGFCIYYLHAPYMSKTSNLLLRKVILEQFEDDKRILLLDKQHSYHEMYNSLFEKHTCKQTILRKPYYFSDVEKIIVEEGVQYDVYRLNDEPLIYIRTKDKKIVWLDEKEAYKAFGFPYKELLLTKEEQDGFIRDFELEFDVEDDLSSNLKPFTDLIKNIGKPAPFDKEVEYTRDENNHKTLTLYHGTSLSILETIKKEGLKNPYLTIVPELAEYYAETKSEETESQAIVLKIIAETKNLRYDEISVDEPVSFDGYSIEDLEKKRSKMREVESTFHPEWVKDDIISIPPEEYKLSLNTVGTCKYEGIIDFSEIKILE